MLTRVGDEHNGRFVRETLAAEGVDVSHVITDPTRLTALAILGIRDRDTFPLLFYRERCADMGLVVGDFDTAFLASSVALCISGTHLSQPHTFDACLTAMRQARTVATRVALDIDYRPVLWGLTSPGLGEQRYVRSEEISEHLQKVIPECDLVVGTEEEIHIAGGSPDTLAALQRLRNLTAGTLVVKRGPMGCVVFPGAIPHDIEQGLKGPGFPVDVFNILGAGDAFMAGFLRGWIRDEPLERCCTYANACGALVVSRHGCAPAMPSWIELQTFLNQGSPTRRLREDTRLERLHRQTTRTRQWDTLAVLAFDHRAQFIDMAAPHGAGAEQIIACKRLIAEGARQGASGAQGAGVILDSRYGEDIFPTLTGCGWWIARPVEQPGSRPVTFEAGNVALELRTWPGEHVAKCLVYFHPDDPPALREQQLDRLRELQAACIATFHEFIVEVLLPADMPSDATTMARALEQIYAADIVPDWWKLPPSPVTTAWDAITRVIHRQDPYCRGVLLLGLDASEEDLYRGFKVAAAYPLVKGFAVGRSIFADMAIAWFAGAASDAEVITGVAQRYARLIALWHEARAIASAAVEPA
jgi:5-dehydro-2-deoxygluconokinase